MKKAVISILIVLASAIAYLSLWPVPIDPLSWQAPRDRGLVDPFAANNYLRRARPIDIGMHQGPEELVLGPDGLLYATSRDGKIIRLRPDGRNLQVYADTGGRPLGIGFDDGGNLWVANATLGLQRVAPDGTVELRVDHTNNNDIVYANNLAIADDGKIYFSNSSSKFGAAAIGDTFEASLLDIMEHGGHGSVLEYNPATDELRTIVRGLNFANGVAISNNQDYLLICETGAYRVLKYWIEGRQAGSSEVLLENLPGFPDNISNGINGRFWIGLIAPRNHLVDELSAAPFKRKLIMRLPRRLRPQAGKSSHVIAFNGDGEILMNLQQRPPGLSALTGVLETPADLYLSTLFGNQLGRLAKSDLASPNSAPVGE